MNKQQVHILVIVGAFDSPEFQRQSQQYFEKLRTAFPNTTFWKSETDDHFTLIENLVDEKAICSVKILEFLKKLIELDKYSYRCGPNNLLSFKALRN